MTHIAADSGPLIVFARSGLLGALRQVAGEVIAPQTVFDECTVNPSKPAASALVEARRRGLLTVHAAVAPPSSLGPVVNLDSGELAVLGVALRLKCPALIDDRLARQLAALHGVPVIGSAGILLAAKSRGLVPEVAPVLSDWRSFGYFLGADLLKRVLERAGEGAETRRHSGFFPHGG